MGPEHGVTGTNAQAPLTGMHHPSLAAVKAGGAMMGNWGRGRQKRIIMDQTSRRPALRPGLNPRDALDMLDIRTRREQQTGGGTADLAGRADAGPDVLQYLAQNGTPDVRAELAVKIGRLMPGLSERESSHIFALTVETLECLARDASVRVRAILAEEIKYLDCIPHDIVLRLAQDVESVVAAPILEYSPLFSDADLIEIIACGQVQQVLTATAKRNPVNEAVSE